MNLYLIFVQSISIIALGLFTFSFHSKTRKGILSFQLAGLAAWFIHFYLLSAWTGAALMIVNAVITTFFLFKENKKWIDNYIFLSVSMLSLVVVTALTWQGYFSLFALFGLSSITLAKWQKTPNTIRKISVLASVFWILYDAFVGSYGGIISETIIIVSIGISLIRVPKEKKSS